MPSMNVDSVCADHSCFTMSQQTIDSYLQNKANKGVSQKSIRKYRTPLQDLLNWFGVSTELTAQRTQDWRKSLVDRGYGKITIQKYVTVANDFFRAIGHEELCISKPVQNDLTGRTFGYLTALEPIDKRHHKYIVWRCICKCGNEAEIPSGMLLGGHTTSCGCLNAEILQYNNRYEEGTALRHSLEERIINPNSVSGYVGVQPKRGKWVAYINYKGVRYNLGTYSKLEDAVKARARGKEAVMEDAARIYKETDHLYGEAPRRPPRPEKMPFVHPDPVIIPALRGDNTSGYTGVTMQKGKWNASICVKGYRYRLGAFENLEDAITARKKAEALVSDGNLDALKAICTNWHK